MSIDGPIEATIGWLFVVGGRQTRVGPHRLYERLATRLAEAGHAVIRFDRRGIGDSEGEDGGYLGCASELAAAAAALRADRPYLAVLTGFGLCDGATALALDGGAAGVDHLVLANPWVVEPSGNLPPPAAIRGHYRRRIADPRAWARLFAGGVDLRKLVKSLTRSTAKEDGVLARRFAAGIPPGTRIILANGDGTAQAFAAAWSQLGAQAPHVETIRIATASHSFADPPAFEALSAALRGSVTRLR